MKRIGLFIPLLIFAAMALLFWVGLGKEDKTSLPSPLIGQPFPAFTAITLVNQVVIDQQQLPDEVYLVNVWATWCPTCKQEHEFLNQLAQQGVNVVGLNYKDDAQQARQWLVDYGDPYLVTIQDPKGQLGLELGVYGAPETYLVDNQGIIRGKHIGDLNPRVWQAFGKQYQALVDGESL